MTHAICINELSACNPPTTDASAQGGDERSNTIEVFPSYKTDPPGEVTYWQIVKDSIGLFKNHVIIFGPLDLFGFPYAIVE